MASDPPADDRPRFTARSGEPIVSGVRYAVTADGLPDVNAPHVLFIAPEHRWRVVSVRVPEVAATVRLTREDHEDRHHPELSPLGLLGVAVYPIRGRFRLVSAAAFQAAADDIAAQLTRCLPPTCATVTLPEGFTLYAVPPTAVAGTVAAVAQTAGTESTPPSPETTVAAGFATGRAVSGDSADATATGAEDILDAG